MIAIATRSRPVIVAPRVRGGLVRLPALSLIGLLLTLRLPALRPAS